mgnify:CR=1 FL=1
MKDPTRLLFFGQDESMNLGLNLLSSCFGGISRRFAVRCVKVPVGGANQYPDIFSGQDTGLPGCLL